MNDSGRDRAQLTPQKRALLEERLQRGRVKAGAPPAIQPAAGDGPWPLSFAQERLWFLDRLYGENPIYNEPSAYRLCGKLDTEALQQALSGLIMRHEVLRSAYSSGDSAPGQLVREPGQVPLPVVDLCEIKREKAEEAWRLQALAAAQAPFDLRRDLMLRAYLYRLADEEYRLLLVKHHIATDGWSSPIILQELSTLYNAAVKQQAAALPPLPVQYKDFAAWQRSQERAGDIERQLAYWREQLQGLPPLELPTDRPYPPQIDHRGGTITFRIPEETAAAIDRLARAQNATRYMVLLSAFFVLLHRYSGQQDFAAGTPVANRQPAQLEPLIGFFVNMLVIRGDLSGEPSFRELLTRLRTTVLEALQYQDLPFAQLITALQPQRQMSRNPLFQVTFQVINRPPLRLELDGIEAEADGLDFGIAKFDIDMAVHTSGDNWTGRWRYASAVFDRETAERMAAHFLRLLEAIVAQPDQAVGRLPLLSEVERQQILVAWNDSARPYPRRSTIHELFAEQVQSGPDRTAVTFGERSLTYAELDSRARALAGTLLRRGVGPGDLVGLALERSPELVTAMLAILKAGAVYVPLDSDYPRERISAMLEDANARVVVTTQRGARSLPDGAYGLVLVDAEREEAEQKREALLLPQGSALDAAYVIYTSGSTGRPKGVIAPHRAVVRLVKNSDYANLGPDQRFMQLAPVSFDAATLEIWGPLLNGGQLFIPPPGPLSLADLAAFLREHAISYLFLTSGLFTRMVDHEVGALAAVAQVQSGGDVVSAAHARRLLQEGGVCRFSVVYGPTENTTYSTFAPLRDANDGGDRLPIGRPIANSTAYILDRYGQPAPIGVAGELCLGGDGLALGYLNDAELTAGRFIPDPFSEEGERLYRSGDLARWQPDGQIEFLGRIDNQVKISGFRIEPGEIENRLAQHAGVAQAVVVPQGTDAAAKRLAAYIVPAAGQQLEAVELKRYLAAHLPGYMVPSSIIMLDQLPLDPNGKIDRRALPEPSQTAVLDPQAITPPRSAEEEALAELWRDLLVLDIVDVHTSFFDAGGHSLLGVRLFALIEERLGKRLPLNLLFESPTIAGLARELAADGEQTADAVLVTIRGEGARPPFFVAHGVFGDVLAFSNFQTHLAPDQPFYGFQAIGLQPGRDPDASIEAMAERYIAAIRRVQPSGPYNLGGFCFGGIVAYEMACQLEAAGEGVALLALMEASAPKQYREGVPITHPLRRASIRQSLPYWINGNRELGGWRIGHRIRQKLGLEEKRRFLRTDGIVPDEEYDNFADHIMWRPPIQRRLRDLNTEIVYAYTPKPYGGRLTLIRAEAVRSGTLLFKPFDPYRGWRSFAQGEIEIRLVAGSHGTIIREHNAADLARVVTEALEEADS